MTLAIILIAALILLGIAGVAVGFHELIDYDVCSGILGIFIGSILLFMSVGILVNVIEDNSETTEKVVGKGTIVTETDLCYFNSGTDNSKDIKYFIEVECGDKIIVDESEWKEIKDEYTYIPSKAEMIKED